MQKVYWVLFWMTNKSSLRFCSGLICFTSCWTVLLTKIQAELRTVLVLPRLQMSLQSQWRGQVLRPGRERVSPLLNSREDVIALLRSWEEGAEELRFIIRPQVKVSGLNPKQTNQVRTKGSMWHP